MDHSMVIILAILTLIAIVLLLYLLPSAPSYDDKSNDKFQQGVRLDQLVRNIAGLEQLLRPIVELTQKHERILTGSQSKGALGEQLVGERLADLPHDWFDRNVPFPGGATVEFALRAPNRRWVPIDSQ